MSGHLRIETDDGDFEVSFRDLERFPECLFAMCTANESRDKRTSIKYERDSKNLSAILKYVSDESGQELERILSSDEESLLAILEDAEFLLFGDLAMNCRRALELFGCQFHIIETITNADRFKETCKRTRNANVAALYINFRRDSGYSHQDLIRLSNREGIRCFAFDLQYGITKWEGMIGGCALAARQWNSRHLQIYDSLNTEQCARIIWLLSSGFSIDSSHNYSIDVDKWPTDLDSDLEELE